MSLENGFKIPSIAVHKSDLGQVEAVDMASYCQGRKVIIFALPGAFTATCSAKHLPGFVAHYDAFKELGVDAIGCLSVNDPFVMSAWGEIHGADGKIDMLGDCQADMTKAIGMDVDMGPLLGVRCARCAFIIEDGVVTASFIEEPRAYEVSSAEHLLAHLKAA